MPPKGLAKAVATLALGSWPRQKFARARAKRNVTKCENEDSHSQVSSHLEVRVLVDFRTFREWLQRSRHLALRSSLYHWKAIEFYMSKMGLHDPFGHLQHKLWQKERPKIKIGSLTPNHKKSGINPTSMRVGDVWHVIRKLSTRTVTLFYTSSQSEVWAQSYSPTKLREFQLW